MQKPKNRYAIAQICRWIQVQKVFATEDKVDKQTLKCCVSAFDLVLEARDYCFPEIPASKIAATEFELEFPERQVN